MPENDDLFARGLAIRCQVLGAEYVVFAERDAGTSR